MAGEGFALEKTNTAALRRLGRHGNHGRCRSPPEVVLGLVMIAATWGAIWGHYGFPRYIEAALVFVALGCIGALVWRRLRR